MNENLLRQLLESLSESELNNLLSGRKLQSTIDSGDTAWLLTSTSLVIFMTLPGLMLYYVGMVRTKNVLATVMQVFSIACLIPVCWLCGGYSLAFGPAVPGAAKSSPVIGDFSRFWFNGMETATVHMNAPTIPESVFCCYQLAFAVITPALICGSFADRMKFLPMLVFMAAWHYIVYCPIAHAVWHPDGFLFQAGVLDYAGGNVVHVISGVSGLVSAIVLGHRKGYGDEAFYPHNILLTAMGSSILWVGWFGFNAGSAVAANDRAGYAMMVTEMSCAVASLTWMAADWYVRKQPSILGIVSGAVAGLVAVTPASGYITITGGFCIGFFAGPLCYFGAQLKHYFGYDDALDSFGVHAIGGTVGGIMCGFFATASVCGIDGVFYADTEIGGNQLLKQLYGIGVSIGWSGFCSYVILKVIDWTIGLRVSEDDEDVGLDVSLHHETVVAVVEQVLKRRSSADYNEPAVAKDIAEDVADAVEMIEQQLKGELYGAQSYGV